MRGEVADLANFNYFNYSMGKNLEIILYLCRIESRNGGNLLTLQKL